MGNLCGTPKDDAGRGAVKTNVSKNLQIKEELMGNEVLKEARARLGEFDYGEDTNLEDTHLEYRPIVQNDDGNQYGG